jgi:hypothetical protein
MEYAVECLGLKIFNWCAIFLENVKDNISICRTRRKKKLGYGSFLVSFFLEWVPLMQPQISLIEHPISEPRMERWTSLSPQLGNEPSYFYFTVNFFSWWRRNIVTVEDYPYVGMDFRGSEYLVFPEGAQLNASGKFQSVTFQKVFLIFYDICIFLWYNEGSKTCLFFHHADRGMMGPARMSPFGQRGVVQVATEACCGVEGLHELEMNLRGLTMGVPSMRL